MHLFIKILMLICVGLGIALNSYGVMVARGKFLAIHIILLAISSICFVYCVISLIG